MSDYAQITDFSAKDALTTGDPEKIILGADLDAELSAISTAVATKYDSNDISSEAQAEALALDTVIITPLQLANVLQDNAGMAYDIQQLVSPGADRILFWDNSEAGVVGLTVGDGLDITGTTLTLPSTVAGYGLSYSAGVLALDGSEITVAALAGADKILFGDISAGDGIRYRTWTDVQTDIIITESQISDLGTYLESGDSAAELTVTTLNIGNVDTSITRDAAGQIAVEGAAVFTHDDAALTSGKIFFSNGVEPTTEGANGDIFLVY